MPTKPKDNDTAEDRGEAVKPDDVTPAVEEATDGPKRLVVVPFADHDYTFTAKRFDSVRFRGLFQQDRIIAAIEYLLGERQYQLFLARTADDEGDTDLGLFYEFVAAIGERIGAGN